MPILKLIACIFCISAGREILPGRVKLARCEPCTTAVQGCARLANMTQQGRMQLLAQTRTVDGRCWWIWRGA